MAVPAGVVFSVTAHMAAHEALKGVIDAGAGPGMLRLRTSADVLLAELVLDDPCGTVDGAGKLTFAFAADGVADAAGLVAYGEFCDSDAEVHLALPAQAGAAAVAGKLVLNSLTLVAGAPVSVVSASVG